MDMTLKMWQETGTKTADALPEWPTLSMAIQVWKDASDIGEMLWLTLEKLSWAEDASKPLQDLIGLTKEQVNQPLDQNYLLL